MPKKTIVFFQRKRREGQNFSMEHIFDDVRSRMPDRFTPEIRVSSYLSNGLLPRVKAIFEARKFQKDVNHVTGDIHFVNLLFKKRRSVLTILDVRFMERSKGIRRLILKWFWLTIPVKKANIITVISQATKDEVLKYTTAEPHKIRVVPVAISESFKPKPNKFNVKKPLLLQVGTAENKNIKRLAAAIEGIECHLHIVGKLNDDLTEKLEKHKIEYSNSFMLSQKEIVQKYEECDIVTFVSTYEGFGMPIIEANVVGRPVITGNILSMPEVAGDAACIVDPFSISEIREGILKIVNDSRYRNQLVENGVSNASRFSAQAIAEMYYKVYDEILAQS